MFEPESPLADKYGTYEPSSTFTQPYSQNAYQDGNALTTTQHLTRIDPHEFSEVGVLDEEIPEASGATARPKSFADLCGERVRDPNFWIQVVLFVVAVGFLICIVLLVVAYTTLQNQRACDVEDLINQRFVSFQDLNNLPSFVSMLHNGKRYYANGGYRGGASECESVLAEHLTEHKLTTDIASVASMFQCPLDTNAEGQQTCSFRFVRSVEPKDLGHCFLHSTCQQQTAETVTSSGVGVTGNYACGFSAGLFVNDYCQIPHECILHTAGTCTLPPTSASRSATFKCNTRMAPEDVYVLKVPSPMPYAYWKQDGNALVLSTCS